MKFSKRYIDDIKEKQPGWRNKFLSYKELKKLIRLIGDDRIAEAEFMCLLNNEIDKLKEFCIEKQEEFIIGHKEIVQTVRNGPNPSETDDFKELKNKIIKDIIDLHGEMVPLINYCNINYTELVKILKKYDRKTGRLRRLPFLHKMFGLFFSTNLITTLAKEYENKINEISQVGGEAYERSNEEVVLDGAKELFKSTIEAIFKTPENVMVFEMSNDSEPNECFNIKKTRWHEKIQFCIIALHLVLEILSFRSFWLSSLT